MNRYKNMKAEINVPESLKEITLEQYQAFLKVYNENDSEEFISQKMVSIFCKIPLSQVLYFRATSITDIMQTLNEMFEQKPKLTQRFKLGDKEFGFIPSLEDMSFGEYIDLETNISDWQTMHKAMAVMYRPITKTKGEQYEIETYHGTANYSEVMKYAPLEVVMGAMVFFYNLGNELLQATLSYLQGEVLTLTAKKSNSGKRGGGIKASTQSQEATLENLRKLQDFQFLPVLPFSPLNNKNTISKERY